jgi:hypothetical protein
MPLELLHFLLIELKLGRHYKGQFKITNILLEMTVKRVNSEFPSQLF